MMTIARMIATVGGVGYLRPAPGTWGSLTALPLAWALHAWGGFPLFAVALLIVIGLGIWATRVVIAPSEDKDPKEVVIDEVAGQWIALLPVSFPAWLHSIEVSALWPGWVTAFVLFRLFDIWKPGPVGRFDRIGGAFGVMMDDVAAGIFAALGVVAMAGLAHGVLNL